MKIVPVLDGDLLIPDGFRPTTEPFCLSMHYLRGDLALMREFCDIGFNAVHYNSKLTGLANQFKAPFYENKKLLGEILNDIEETVQEAFTEPNLRMGNIAISAFSAGYAAVREILRNPDYFDRIKTLIMADTIYASWVSNEVRIPKLEQMVDFMLFAQAAARGEKSFIVTHIDYDCDRAGYCSTRKTADMLLASVGGTRSTAVEAIETRRPVTSRCDIGEFHLLHFADMDHEYQLKLIPELWRIYGLGLAIP